MAEFEAAYIKAHASGLLKERAEEARARLADCDICARVCRVNRLKGEEGACCTGEDARVCSFQSHFGEEAPLVGSHGSGTVFFSFCNLKCRFCQNYELSVEGEGREVTAEQLAGMMLQLEHLGCHNINLVSPSHVVSQILDALCIAAAHRLSLPLVYNTGGYDSLETLRQLDGIVDIYMPDMKYADEATAREYSGVPEYPAANHAGIIEMHRQVGDLALDAHGVARRGLLVRHLVLPEGLAGTAEIARFLAENVSKDTYINIMDQYRPCYRATGLPPLNRRLTREEYLQAMAAAEDAGLHRFDERRRWHT